MKNHKVMKKLENTYRRMRGEISQAELVRLNKELDDPQLVLGIGAVTEPPRRQLHG